MPKRANARFTNPTRFTTPKMMVRVDMDSQANSLSSKPAVPMIMRMYPLNSMNFFFSIVIIPWYGRAGSKDCDYFWLIWCCLSPNPPTPCLWYLFPPCRLAASAACTVGYPPPHNRGVACGEGCNPMNIYGEFKRGEAPLLKKSPSPAEHLVRRGGSSWRFNLKGLRGWGKDGNGGEWLMLT